MPDARVESPALAVLGEDGWSLLLAAGVAVEGAGGDILTAASALASARSDAPAPQRASALELVTEGARLAAKLGLSERMLAVREAVEQASAGRVAIWHATRIPEGARVLEIGCGCGADSVALAHRATNLIAADLDPVRAACTHMNLMTLELGNARAVPGDGFDLLEGDAARADAVFADPSRRRGTRRLRNPEEWSPPLSKLVALASGPRAVLIKAGPFLDPEAAGPGFRVSYVSYGGECVEAFLESHRPDVGRVFAVQLSDGEDEVELSGDRRQAPERAVGEALYVPDPAAIRASLLAELCSRHDLDLVDGSIAFLTGAAGVESPWLTPHAVILEMPLRPVDVGNALRRLGASAVRVHTRGVSLTAPELERRFAKAVDPKGGGPVVDVFATRSLGRPVAILTRRDPAE